MLFKAEIRKLFADGIFLFLIADKDKAVNVGLGETVKRILPVGETKLRADISVGVIHIQRRMQRERQIMVLQILRNLHVHRIGKLRKHVI